MDPPSPVLILLNHHRDVPQLIVRPATLQEAITEARELFGLPENANVSITTQYKTAGGVRAVALSKASWEVVILGRKVEKDEDPLELEVLVKDSSKVLGKRKLEEEEDDVKHPPTPQSRSLPLSIAATHRQLAILSTPRSDSTSPITVILRQDGGVELTVRCKPTTPMAKLWSVFARWTAAPDNSFEIWAEGEKIPHKSQMSVVEALEVYNGNSQPFLLDVWWAVIGGKPVIYLFPPKKLNKVKVQLTLVPAWKFSAVYPLTDISSTEKKENTLTWKVSASPNGTLVDLASKEKEELSYLYWEAHTVPPYPQAQVQEPPRDPLAWDDDWNRLKPCDPLRPLLTDCNSVLLPFELFLPHLSFALGRLTLHTSARNDFITYWLPKFVAIRNRNQHILMRFLPQNEYEPAAPLKVDPSPDVVTRVFMIFAGVDAEECEEQRWSQARWYGKTVDWRKVVGVKDNALDAKLFRVLEWGGMEVRQ